MVLSQIDLKKEVEDGLVVFDPPLEDKQWGEASVDLRLGFSFTKLKEISGLKISIADGLGALGDSGFWQQQTLKETDELGKTPTYSLEPGEFVLAMTYEKITVPKHLIAIVEGRSTYARVGLSMHQTAPWIQPGWKGPIVLEIYNNGPLTIVLTPKVDRLCQLTFLKLQTELPEALSYGARTTDIYQHQTHPLSHKKKKK